MATKKSPGPKKASATKAKTVKAVAKKAAPAPAQTVAMQDNIASIGKVNLTMTAELGRTRDTIGRVMDYGEQSLIELDRSVGDPVDIMLNGELFARGEVVTVSENFGVRVTEVVARPGG